MRNTIRCCISCILPCGALDVVRIVHANGRVEELSGTILAADIMKAHPKHVLKKPSSPPSSDIHHQHNNNDDDVSAPKIVIVPPDALLQRGKIYFLMPAAVSAPSDHHHHHHHHHNKQRSRSSVKMVRSSKKSSSGSDSGGSEHHHHHGTASDINMNKSNSISMAAANLVVSDRYLSDILSEKVSTQRDRRRGRVNVWRPHLESISETLIE